MDGHIGNQSHEKITYSELTKEVLDQLGTVYWGEPDQETYSDIDPTEAIFQAIDLYDWEELQELTELKNSCSETKDPYTRPSLGQCVAKSR
jgi:hypothetical protein